MAVIEIDNIYSKILNCTPNGINAASDAIALMVPGCEFVPSYRQGVWDGRIRFLKISAKSAKFPTGLLTTVLKAMRNSGEKVYLEDMRMPIDVQIDSSVELLDSKLGTITLRDYQYDSVYKSLDATRGIINVATNGGKTEIACGIIKYVLPAIKDNQRIVFFTHAKEIFYQSHKRLEERLGIKVGLIGDEIWEERQVTVVMIPTLSKYLEVPKELPKNAKRTKLLKQMVEADTITQKRLRSEIDAMEKEEWVNLRNKIAKTDAFLSNVVGFIADEVHHASSDTWYSLLMKIDTAFFRFGLTGTVDQEGDPIGVMKLTGCTGKIIIKITNQFLIDNGFSAKPTINLLRFKSRKLRGGDPRDIINEGIINNIERNSVFVNQIVKSANSGGQCLIIVAETTHGEIVKDLLADRGIESAFTHGKKTSKFRQDTLKEFTEGKIQVLIATPILDEGVDVSGINNLFLMAGGKSMKKLLQRIGRGIRKKSDDSGVAIYDSVDMHSLSLSYHYEERLQTYKAEGFDIVFHDLST